MSAPSNKTGKSPPDVLQPAAPCLLTVNGGSSSLKFAFVPTLWTGRGWAAWGVRILGGMIDRIGLPDARMSVKRSDRAEVDAWNLSAPSLDKAADRLIDWLVQTVGSDVINGAGFRVVHGGPRYHRPERITAELIASEAAAARVPLDV